jgi:hypothetical protein
MYLNLLGLLKVPSCGRRKVRRRYDYMHCSEDTQKFRHGSITVVTVEERGPYQHVHHVIRKQQHLSMPTYDFVNPG